MALFGKLAMTSAERKENMSEIDLYVHSANDPEPRLMKVEEEILVAELVCKIVEAGVSAGSHEEIFIFVENETEPLSREHSARHCGLKHRHHIHSHKCHRIQVGVTYNGVEKTEAFAPSTKVRQLLKWSVDAFKLKGADAENKILRLATPPEAELSNDAHVGSYANAPGCGVKLCLLAPIRFQG
jgi:hypothetical protein